MIQSVDMVKWYSMYYDALYGCCDRFACYKDEYGLDYNSDDCYQCPYDIPPYDYIGEIYYP